MEIIKRSELFAKLGNFISVKNLASRNGRGIAPNQFELTFENGKVFQSYKTMIAVRYNGKLYLSPSHIYSNTTSRHCTAWSGYNSKERIAGLKNGNFTFIYDDI